MLDAPGIAHAAGRNDNGRAADLVDGPRFGTAQGVAQVGQGEGIVAAVQQGLGVFVEQLAVALENFRGTDGQGTVHENRHVPGQFALAVEHVQAVEHLLRALHGKGRNDHLFASGVAVGHGLGQLLGAAAFIPVVAVAVCGFHEHIISPGRIFRVADNQRLGAADVAGKDHAGGLAVFFGFQPQGAGTQNVPGVVIGYADARRGLKAFVIVHGVKEGGRLAGVLHAIKSGRGIFQTPALVLLGFPQGFHFLDVGAVLQHDFQQIAGGLGAVDGFAETVFGQQGQQAGMIHMGVGDQNKINVFGLVGLNIAVAPVNGLVALVHAAVHAETPAACLNHITGAGDCLGRSQKLYFHMHSDGWRYFFT